MPEQKFVGWYGILVVVAIVAIIAGVAVPSILISRMSCNEAGAIELCLNLKQAQKNYAVQNEGKFADIEILLKENYLNRKFSYCTPGYFYHHVFLRKGKEGDKNPEYIFQFRPKSGEGRYIFEISSNRGLRYLGSISAKYKHPKYKPGSIIYP